MLPLLRSLANLTLLSFAASSLCFAADPAPPAPRQGKLEFRVEPITIANYMREPQVRHPHLSFTVGGELAREVRAARVIVFRASDNTGRDLQGPSKPAFIHTAVGSVSRDEFLGPIPPKIGCDLSAVAPEAKTIRVEGRVELVIPARHRDAIAVITNVPGRAGGPVESDALSKAGITLEIYDQHTYEAKLATYRNQTGGFTDYGMGAYFPSSMLATMTPEARAALYKVADDMLARNPPPKLTNRDIALALTDPDQRLVGFEFVAGDNARLVYNRNGWAHYESTPGKRLDIYRLQGDIPADLKLICWLAIDKSMVVIPFEMQDVPLPPPRAAPAPAAAPIPAPDVR